MRRLAPILFLSTLLLSVARISQAKSNHTSSANEFSFTALNTTDASRTDELLRVDLSAIVSGHSNFNKHSFDVKCNGEEVPCQFDEGILTNSAPCILVLTSFAPHQKKLFIISWKLYGKETQEYEKMAQAVIGMKVDYKKADGYYTGGRFIEVDSTTVPPDHFAHDALYRIEGPGWESDKIVYRFYLDSRNRNDIFGKKANRLVLQKLGVDDLVSNSKESYTNMLDWGMDIFKVGESLGIGSIAMWQDSKAVTVSDVKTVKSYVSENGPILAGICTRYIGWKVGGDSFELESHMTISGGSRMTRVDLNLNGKPLPLCTGLAKHEGCQFLTSHPGSRKGWAYIALYGSQSLSGDGLGIALFYETSDEMELTDDSLSEIVVFSPRVGRLTYYFAAAWQQEPGGIKNVGEFRKYLDGSVERLDNPIKISF